MSAITLFHPHPFKTVFVDNWQSTGAEVSSLLLHTVFLGFDNVSHKKNSIKAGLDKGGEKA